MFTVQSHAARPESRPAAARGYPGQARRARRVDTRPRYRSAHLRHYAGRPGRFQNAAIRKVIAEWNSVGGSGKAVNQPVRLGTAASRHSLLADFTPNCIGAEMWDDIFAKFAMG